MIGTLGMTKTTSPSSKQPSCPQLVISCLFSDTAGEAKWGVLLGWGLVVGGLGCVTGGLEGDLVLTQAATITRPLHCFVLETCPKRAKTFVFIGPNSSGQDTVQASSLLRVLNISLRTSDAQLG